MKREAIVATLLALAACQRQDAVDKARLDDLATRVSALEQRQRAMQQTAEVKQDAAEPSADQPVTMWAFEEGPASHRYASRERCAAALDAFEAARMARDAASGVTVVRGTEPACNPVPSGAD